MTIGIVYSNQSYHSNNDTCYDNDYDNEVKQLQDHERQYATSFIMMNQRKRTRIQLQNNNNNNTQHTTVTTTMVDNDQHGMDICCCSDRTIIPTNVQYSGSRIQQHQHQHQHQQHQQRLVIQKPRMNHQNNLWYVYYNPRQVIVLAMIAVLITVLSPPETFCTTTAFVATTTTTSSTVSSSSSLSTIRSTTTTTTQLHVSNDFTRPTSSSITQVGFHYQQQYDPQQQQQQQLTTGISKPRRFGIVRKRVRAVLDYAKRRTGFTPTIVVSSSATTTTGTTTASSSSSSSSFSSLSVNEQYNRLLSSSSSLSPTALLVKTNNNNSNNEKQQQQQDSISAAQVIAEAASIGGMSDTSADFVLVNNPSSSIKKNGSNYTNNNGSSTSLSNGYNPITAAAPKPTVVAVRNNNGMITLEQLQGRNGTEIDITLQEQTQQPTPKKINGSSNENQSIAQQPTSPSPLNQQQNVQVDAILNSGVSGKIKPLPFRLPKLSNEQKQRLINGERIQEQSKMGRDGSGYVVLDLKAPDYVIWECLLDFEKYPEYIGTVRSMQMFTNTHLKQSYIAEKPVLPGTGRETRHYGISSITRASFVLSKFLLKIAAIHQYYPHPNGHYMIFTLDKANKNVVLKDAKGIWYTECNPDGREGYTRVWLLCELSVSRVLPTFIVDYAAKRAMPRASNWIKPVVERVKKEFNIMD